jgi:hypothetical protein
MLAMSVQGHRTNPLTRERAARGNAQGRSNQASHRPRLSPSSRDPDSGRWSRRAANGRCTFCDTCSMPYKTRSDLRREPSGDFMRFCFADPAHADAFMAEFGGERITIEPQKSVWPVLSNR